MSDEASRSRTRERSVFETEIQVTKLRDQLAAAALTGLLTRDVVEAPEVTVRRAYTLADAALVARKGP